MLGNSLTSTLLGLRAGLEGFDTVATGVVLSAYYAGFIAGSLLSPRGIQRVGHVRVFSGLASLASATVLVHAVSASVPSWFVLRAVSGLCIAGLFVVVETWMNATTTNANRGGLLAAYMTVISASMAGGQLLLLAVDPGGFVAFVLASVLVSLAVVPVSLTPVAAPALTEPTPLSLRAVVATAPLAVLTSAMAGLVASAVVGTLAVYATLSGISANRTATLLAGALVFAVGIHMPVGRWSDRVDRRQVIVALGGLGAAAAVGGALLSAGSPALALVVAVAGGVAFPLYSLANAHLNDYLSSGAVAEGGARIVLVNGMGAVAGPVAVSVAMSVGGPGGLFVVVAGAYLVTAAYGIWRITRRAPATEDQRWRFVAFPQGTATTVATLEPDAAPGLFPVLDGELDTGEVVISWTDQGNVGAVVILEGEGWRSGDGDGAAEAGPWDRLAEELAATGLRVVRIPPEGDLDPSALAALARDREIVGAVVVAPSVLAGLAGRFAAEYPELVASVVEPADGQTPVAVAERILDLAPRAPLA